MISPGSLRARAIYNDEPFDPRSGLRKPQKRSAYGKLIDDFTARREMHCCIYAKSYNEMKNIAIGIRRIIGLEAWPLTVNWRGADLTVHIQKEV